MTDFASSRPYTEAEREADAEARRPAFERFRRKARSVSNIRFYFGKPTAAELAVAKRMLGEHSET